MRRTLIALVAALPLAALSVGLTAPQAHGQNATLEQVENKPTLSRGDTGPAVEEWQSWLNDWLETRSDQGPLATDGIFGPMTESATRTFQRSQAVPVDGIVGPVTRAAFLSAPALATQEPDPAADEPLISIGDVGDEVAGWQERLNEWLKVNRTGIGMLAVDGFFGGRTAGATRVFQEAQRITVDGVVGPETRAALRSAPTLLADGSGEGPLLSRGDTGDAVATWQDRLNDWLQLERSESGRLAVDGVFGHRTEAATLDLQRSEGILVDGIVGPQTRAALDLVLEERAST